MPPSADSERTWVGLFVLIPGQAPRRGELRYHPSRGIELHIHDHAASEHSLSWPWGLRKQLETYSEIHGIIEGHWPVTLIQCFERGRQANPSGFEQQQIVVNTILFGPPNPDLKSKLISGFHFASPNLVSWVDQLGFQTKHGSRHGITFQWKRPAGFGDFGIDDLRTLSVFFGHESMMGLENGSLHFRIRPEIRVRYEEKQPWSSAAEDIRSLDSFFCFVTRQWRGPPSVGILTDYSRKARNEESRRKSFYEEPHPVLLSEQWYDLSGGSRRTLFRFPGDGRELAGLIQRWFAHREVLEHALSLLRATETADVDVATSFLFVAQAAEFLHRETIGGSLMPNEEFAAVYDGLVASLSPRLQKDVASTLKQRLQYQNELSLQRRPKDLFRFVKERPDFISDYKGVCRMIADERNRLTHHLRSDADPEWPARAADLSEILIGLVELTFCRLLGFSEDRAFEMLRSNYDLRRRFGIPALAQL